MKQYKTKEVAEKLGIDVKKLQLLLEDLNWIEKAQKKGWLITKKGEEKGGSQHTFMGSSYIKWDEKILKEKILLTLTQPETETKDSKDIKEKFPCNIKTSDGHMVRSRAEAIICDWFYANRISYAYEKRLPIEENVYCDFYVPDGKIYIEFWGLDDEKYNKRKEIKQALYKKYDFNLIELGNDEITRVDDELPRLLLKFQK